PSGAASGCRTRARTRRHSSSWASQRYLVSWRTAVAAASARERRCREHDGRALRLAEQGPGIELRAALPLDRSAERLEERIRRVEEVERRGAVVHRHDEPRTQGAHDL